MLLGHDVGDAVLPSTVLPPALAWALAAAAVVATGWFARWLVRARSAGVWGPARERRLTLALLETFIETSDAPILAKDATGRYVAMNPAAGALLNVDPKLALGRRAGDIFGRELAARIEALDRRILAHGGCESFEEEFDTAQGRRLFRTTKGALRDAGRIVGVYGITRDITALREQQEELARLQTAVDRSPESIVVTDVEARIVYANAAAEAISGYRRDELVGCNSRLLQSGKTPRATYAALWTALGRGQPWHGVFFNRRKDGSEYTEEATITPLRMAHGRITHYLAIKKDVTEQQRMAAELERYRAGLEDLVAERTAELEQARRAAETANESKSAFLATISHELRTPMNGVVGLAEVLARSDLNPYQGDLVRTMRESSFGLLALIDDLLDLSKIEAGRLDLERRPVELRELVEGACDALQPGAAARGVLLQVYVAPALPAQVLLDAVRFRQIVDNLASNAIKFSGGLERAGCVRVRVDGVDGADGPMLRLQVVDNGIGMSAQTLARIFEPYAQADASTARRYGGTGLGMPIVQRLAHAFGGRVEVRSALEQGSTVTVCIPLAAAGAEAEAPGAASLRGLRCLVCADDPQLGADWEAYLAAAGAAVDQWSDPLALRAALAAHAGAARVAVVGIDWAAALANDLRSAAQLGSAGLVLVGRGQRRRPRRAHGGEVVLDADALHRAALVDAVALAAGRRATSAVEDVPVGPEPAEPDFTLPPPLPAGTRVLVAEDNPINQEVIRHQLALLGVEVDLAADGEAALARWREGGCAMLLTDLRMPGVDGYELARRLRAEEGAGARTPIVALTAAALYGEAERCRSAGMDDYTTKPLTLPRLAA
ncbi:MAG TPA: PAS domain S-box protein, partial [Rubrivivax sp.]|nr:PAS domain S-box protein [Rubrivivax sp.]